MKKLFNLKRDGIFLVLSKHAIAFSTAGQLFLSAWMTQEEADAINKDFPNTAFVA